MNVTGWFWANCSDLRTSLPWFPSVFGIHTDISIISGIFWQPMVYLLVRNVPPSQQHLPINLQLGEHPNFFSEILPVNLTTARPLQRLLQYFRSLPSQRRFRELPEQGGFIAACGLRWTSSWKEDKTAALDLLIQRIKAVEAIANGTHYSVAKQPTRRKIHKGKGQDLHTGTSQPSKLPLKKRLDAFQQHVDSLKETIRKGKEKETRRSRRTQHLALATVSPSSRGKCIYPKNHWTLIYYLYCLCFSAGFWDSKPPALTSHEYEYTLERLDELIPKKTLFGSDDFWNVFFCFIFCVFFEVNETLVFRRVCIHGVMVEEWELVEVLPVCCPPSKICCSTKANRSVVWGDVYNRI